MAIPPDGKFRSLSRIARFPVGIDSYARPQGPPEGLPLSGPCHPDRGRLSDALRSWFEAASLDQLHSRPAKTLPAGKSEAHLLAGATVRDANCRPWVAVEAFVLPLRPKWWAHITRKELR